MEDVAVPATLGTSKGNGDGVYVIPAGHIALSSPAVSQMDPKIWNHANEWDPYRWNDPEGIAAREYEKYTDNSSEKVDFGFGSVSKGTNRYASNIFHLIFYIYL
jgi:sterol 14-demethylase